MAEHKEVTKHPVDIIVSLEYDVKHPNKTKIITNAKKERVVDLLSNWFQITQLGQGKDLRKPNIKDVYKIKIGIDLSDDSFYTKSDTGNKGLTCGIVIDVLSRLQNGEIENFGKKAN